RSIHHPHLPVSHLPEVLSCVRAGPTGPACFLLFVFIPCVLLLGTVVRISTRIPPVPSPPVCPSKLHLFARSSPVNPKYRTAWNAWRNAPVESLKPKSQHLRRLAMECLSS